MNYKQIVWLASYPKSGNTWVRCFLDAYFLGEVDINELLSTISDDQSQWYQVGDGSDAEDFPKEIQFLCRSMALVRAVRHYNSIDEKPIPFFVKTHNACMQINGNELVPDLLTKATIYIVRDPRDVLPSFANHIGYDIDQTLEYMCEKYRMLSGPGKVTDFLSSWHGHVLSYLETFNHNVKMFKYEDMKADPVDNFSRILKHAGIEPDSDLVANALEMVKLSKLKAQEEKKGFGEASPKAVNPFFHKGESGSWKDTLTPKQLHLIEKRFGSVMRRLGYIGKRKAA